MFDVEKFAEIYKHHINFMDEQYDECWETDFDEIKDFDFSNAILHGLNFANSKFVNCNFLLADFRCCDFTDCEFIGCKFFHTKLREACLVGSLFVDTSFDYCDASYCSFDHCKLEGTTFKVTDFIGTFMGECSFDQCQFEKCTLIGDDMTKSTFKGPNPTKLISCITENFKDEYFNGIEYLVIENGKDELNTKKDVEEKKEEVKIDPKKLSNRFIRKMLAMSMKGY